MEKAPTRVLRTTTSPAAGATRSSMAVVGESAWNAPPESRTNAPIRLDSGKSKSSSSKATRT